MFDLENAISRWRKEMRAAGIKKTSLDELEEHLRSDVEQREKGNIDAATAFAAAIAQLGSPARVRDEFTKARPRTGAAFESWISAGAILFVAFTLVFVGIIFFALHMSAGQQVMAFAGVCLLLVIGCGWRHALPYVPAYSGTRQFIGGIGFAWSVTVAMGVLAAFVLPNIVNNAIEEGSPHATNNLIIALIWTGAPIASTICLAVAFLMNDQERARWGMIPRENS